MYLICREKAFDFIQLSVLLIEGPDSRQNHCLLGLLWPQKFQQRKQLWRRQKEVPNYVLVSVTESVSLLMLWDRFHQGWGVPLEKPISLLNMGHCFQVPTHSVTTIFHIMISTTNKRHFLISLWERVPLEAETHLSLSVFLWIILESLFQCDATI